MNKYHQNGAGVLIAFLIVFAVGSTVFLAGLKNQRPGIRQERNMLEEMLTAKAAILSFATNYPNLDAAFTDGVGRFPCADTDNDGVENCPSTIGRLPESIILPSSSGSFHISNQYSNIDQQLWYAISPSFVRSTGSVLNTSTVGSYTVDESPDEIIGVIIAPGNALAEENQDRSNASDITSYLEADNQIDNNKFDSHGSNPENFNDRIVKITRNDINDFISITAIKAAIEINSELQSYHQTLLWRWSWDTNSWSQIRSFPYAGYIWTPETSTVNYNLQESFQHSIRNIDTWIQNDDWNEVATYTYINNDTATFSFSGCSAITFTVTFNSDLSMNQKRC